jgi:hypothetical protein
VGDGVGLLSSVAHPGVIGLHADLGQDADGSLVDNLQVFDRSVPAWVHRRAGGQIILA